MKQIHFLLCTVVILVFWSCENREGKQGVIGPPGPSLKGTISGFVRMYDEYSNQLSTANGAVISLEGTSFAIQSDSLGKWKLQSVPTGIYSIDFIKNGFGINKRLGFQFVGGGETFLGSVPIAEVPSYNVINLTVAVNDSQKYFQLSGNFSTVGMVNKIRRVLFCVGRDSSVSSEPLHYLYTFLETYDADSINFTRRIFASTVPDIPEETPVYFTAYGISAFVISYVDFETGRLVYPSVSLNRSNVVNVVKP